MKSAFISLAAVLAITAAHAQPTPETQKLAAQVVPCMGGTGSPVTSIGTTPTLVCNGNSQTRRWFFSIQNVTQTATNNAFCTLDGSTPSATNWTLAIYQNVVNSSYLYPTFVPGGPIWCISGTGTPLPIAANAAQTGIAP